MRGNITAAGIGSGRRVGFGGFLLPEGSPPFGSLFSDILLASGRRPEIHTANDPMPSATAVIRRIQVLAPQVEWNRLTDSDPRQNRTTSVRNLTVSAYRVDIAGGPNSDMGECVCSATRHQTGFNSIVPRGRKMDMPRFGPQVHKIDAENGPTPADNGRRGEFPCFPRAPPERWQSQRMRLRRHTGILFIDDIT